MKTIETDPRLVVAAVIEKYDHRLKTETDPVEIDKTIRAIEMAILSIKLRAGCDL